MTTKTIIIAQGKEDGVQRYLLGGGAGYTSEDIAQVALFNSPETAKPTVDRLIERNYERTHNCELLLGEVEIVVRAISPVVRKPVGKGWVIRRGDGQFYHGPKTRNAKNFNEAHYKYVANPESATMFPSREVAEERARGIQAQLDHVADAGSTTNRDSYLRIARTFSPTFREL